MIYIPWKGFGGSLLLLIGISFFIVNYSLSSFELDFKMILGFSFLLADILLLLTYWKDGRNRQMLAQMKDQEKKQKMEAAMAQNPMMDLKNSSLFFIPLEYWRYILVGLGGVFILWSLF